MSRPEFCILGSLGPGPPLPAGAWRPGPHSPPGVRRRRETPNPEVSAIRPNKLRQLLNEGKPSLATHIHTTWPNIVEVVGHTGLYDYVEFVAEYGPYDLYAFDDLCRAAELHDLGMMIKVEQDPRSWIAQRAIGSGFGAVLFSDCRSAEEVRQCVRMATPDTPEDGGTYGVATRRNSYMGYGGSPEYCQSLRDVVVMMMIEKGGAVAELDQILAIDGVDMIQWGPADYSMSTGRVRGSAEVKAVEKRVLQAALAAGVQPRAEINSPDEARYYLDLGVRHFCIGTDVAVLFSWLKQNGDALRKVVEGA
ncbi:MAG: aldolase/citrate lyase family protein [Gemmatimonadota bacterium]